MFCMSMHRADTEWCNVATGRTLQFLYSSSLLVEQVEIRLPADCHDTAEDAAVLNGHVGEAKGRDCGPDFAAVPPASGHCVADALDDFGKGAAGEEGLHAEEVRVE